MTNEKTTRRKVLKRFGLAGSISIGLPAFADTAIAHNLEIVFEGCQRVFLVVNDRSEFGVLKETVIVEQDGTESRVNIELTSENTEPIPDRFGNRPVFNFTASDGQVITAVETGDGRVFENPNECREEEQCSPVQNDIMLVIDRSASMDQQEGKLQEAIEGAEGLIGQLAANDRIGLVSFADDARADSSLSQNFGEVQSAVRDLEGQANGDTNLAGGVNVAHDELVANSRTDAEQIMIVLADGEHNTGDLNPQTEAQEAKDAGIRVLTVAIPELQGGELEEMASEPLDQNFFNIEGIENISTIFETIAQEICP